jgi:hypothetical protein
MRRREFLAAVAGIGAGAWAGERVAVGEAPQRRGQPSRAAAGPLRAHTRNPRYFSDGTGRAIYLTGSHVWNNLVDMGAGDPPPRFDFGAYLDFLERYGHNFIRLWAWEHSSWDTSANGRWGKKTPHTVAPLPWARTGPGKALDGKPKFDVTKFDEDYFKRLRSRVVAAGERGVYVSVMLFEGWAMQHMHDAWVSHPFHPKNNVSGIDGDADGDGRGLEIHTLASPAVTARQEAYVRKVIDTVGDLDNVLYEISNENHPESTEWQYHMIDLIHRYERRQPKQHPVGMTFQYRGGSNQTLFESPADWISPNAEGGYRDDPPASDGRKVVLSDTDHLWGIGGNQAWVWKSFLRGLNPLFMDPYDGLVLAERFDPQWEPIRRSLGHTRRLAERMDLAACTPQSDLASTKYCLADPGREYLVYLPSAGKVTVNLSAAKGRLRAEWIDPGTGKSNHAGDVSGGDRRTLTAPARGDAVLYLHRV